MESAYDWVSAMITALLVLATLSLCLVRVIRVDGDSMVPTLTDGDRLLLFSAADEYAPGDIVVIDRYTQSPLIKRVIAVAGDTLDIRPTGDVYRNGELLTEPYIQGATVLRDFSGPLTIPEGYLFVMGDNRSVSLDSRSREVGLIFAKDVVGKVVFRVWPPTAIGGVRGRAYTQ